MIRLLRFLILMHSYSVSTFSRRLFQPFISAIMGQKKEVDRTIYLRDVILGQVGSILREGRAQIDMPDKKWGSLLFLISS